VSNNQESELPVWGTHNGELSEADLNQVVGGKKVGPYGEPIEPVAV